MQVESVQFPMVTQPNPLSEIEKVAEHGIEIDCEEILELGMEIDSYG